MGNVFTGIVAGATAINSALTAKKEIKASNQAAEAATAANQAAIQEVKDAQANASSKAAEVIKQKRGGFTQTIYTSPLGVSDQASTTKKTLLGQ